MRSSCSQFAVGHTPAPGPRGRIQATLDHPHVVSVTDVIEHNGHPGLVMEYIEGHSLDRVLASTGSLSIPVALSLSAQIFGAIAAAHARSVLHRDLKPANVMLEPITGGVRAMVTDFGIARLMADTNGDTPPGRLSGHAWLHGARAGVRPHRRRRAGRHLQPRSTSSTAWFVGGLRSCLPLRSSTLSEPHPPPTFPASAASVPTAQHRLDHRSRTCSRSGGSSGHGRSLRRAVVRGLRADAGGRRPGGRGRPRAAGLSNGRRFRRVGADHRHTPDRSTESDSRPRHIRRRSKTIASMLDAEDAGESAPNLAVLLADAAAAIRAVDSTSPISEGRHRLTATTAEGAPPTEAPETEAPATTSAGPQPVPAADDAPSPNTLDAVQAVRGPSRWPWAVAGLVLLGLGALLQPDSPQPPRPFPHQSSSPHPPPRRPVHLRQRRLPYRFPRSHPRPNSRSRSGRIQADRPDTLAAAHCGTRTYGTIQFVFTLRSPTLHRGSQSLPEATPPPEAASPPPPTEAPSPRRRAPTPRP